MRKPDEASRGIDAHYLAEVVHELRSPLGGIDAMAELLVNTELTGDQRRLVDALRAASLHLRAIADDVLDRTAIGRNAFKWNEKSFNLPDMLAQIAVAAEARAAAKGLWFSHDAANTLPEEVTADSRCIRQMIENLVDNAIKVTSLGQIRLSISVTDQRGAFLGLRFEVSDTGPGFSAMEKEKLFKPFGRLDNDARGTGLGLSMVNRLARAMGGEVGCESSPGNGASFWFTVRVKTPHLDDQSRNSDNSVHNHARDISENLKPRSDVILVVDDNQTNRQIMQVMLEHFGYSTIEAETGEQALKILETTKVFAIMLDQTLPGMSGVETLSAIRSAQEEWATIPVVPVTGRVTGADRAAFARAGATGFVEKPVTARSIKNALEAAVNSWAGVKKSAA
jgi:CheY-like chemotaxis protein/anti-sigma regulatory factor (Ser/Thr protein kinase)